ncbi:MAG: response regulator [Devosiaceae bacterium]|nr:response regulator [Devosiaceae bacterium MH13]
MVDDSAYMRRIVCAMLRGFGARRIIEAEDGAEALEKIDMQPPDLIITDWVMPVLDGAEMVKMIRTPSSVCAYAPIIMLSGHTERSRVLTASKLGINHFLSKPVSASVLYQRIGDCVLHPRKFIQSDDYFGPEPREVSEMVSRARVGVLLDDSGTPVELAS